MAPPAEGEKLRLAHPQGGAAGKTLEFKRDLSSPRPALCTLIAFANSAGGRLVIGVDAALIAELRRRIDLES